MKKFFKWLGKAMMRNKKTTAIALVLLFLAGYALFDNKGIITRVRMTMQRDEEAKKVKAVEEENKRIQEQNKALQTDKKAIEKVAREKYGMVKKGEKVYRVQPQPAKPEKK